MSAAAAHLRLPTLEAVNAVLMKKSLADFVKGAWHVIEPVTPLVWNWHVQVMCDHVQALLEDRLGKQNLAIAVPPGSMKSTVVSVCAPAWKWLHNAGWRATFAAGNDDVAERDSGKCRDVLNSDWYRTTFRPQWVFAKDQNAKMKYRNSMTGFRTATTTKAGITGTRPNDLFVDDPLDVRVAYQEVAREDVIKWWRAAGNRLADMTTGHRCIIMQRLHEEDLIGYILDTEPDEWELLTIPQEWEERLRITTSLGWTDPRTEEGELLFPKRFPERVLVGERTRLGSSGYQGQHQQRPSALEGELFKRGHAQFICPSLIPQSAMHQTAISWDTAVKEKETNDWSVSLVGTEFDRGVLIREEIRIKTGYPGLREATMLQAQRIRPSALLIEDKQSGQQLIQELNASTSLPIIAVQPVIDKVARAWALVPYWESNRVFFPCDENGVPEPWVEPFLAELHSFPKAAHDDRVDAFTQLLKFLALDGSTAGILAWAQSLSATPRAAAHAPSTTNSDRSNTPTPLPQRHDALKIAR